MKGRRNGPSKTGIVFLNVLPPHRVEHQDRNRPPQPTQYQCVGNGEIRFTRAHDKTKRGVGYVGSAPEYDFAKILEDAVHKAVETFPPHGGLFT